MSTNSPTDSNYGAAFTKIFLESYFNLLKQILVGIQLLCSLVIFFPALCSGSFSTAKN